MRRRKDNLSSFRWRFAATVDPEVVVLVLAIPFALGVLLIVEFGSSSGNTKYRSPGPSSEPRPSGSISFIRMREVGASTASPWLIEVDPT